MNKIKLNVLKNNDEVKKFNRSTLMEIWDEKRYSMQIANFPPFKDCEIFHKSNFKLIELYNQCVFELTALIWLCIRTIFSKYDLNSRSTLIENTYNTFHI